MRHVLQDFLAVPTVVSAGEDVDAHIQQLVSQSRRNAKTGRGVLAIGDDQVDLFLRNDVRKAVLHNLPPGRTDDISDEKNAHERVPTEANNKKERTAAPW